MRTTLLLLVLLAGPALASQTVWKWVDEDGVTHYSDRPVPGATRMEVAGGGGKQSNSTYSAPSSPDAGTQQKPTANVRPYADFEIWKPSPDEVIINTGGSVQINVRVEPVLQAGHDVALYLDGALVQGYDGNTTEFNLMEVPRGEHTAVAVITDQSGQRIQETPSVHFTVRQESIAQPPVGPAQRPPPKPRPNLSNKAATAQPTYADLNGGRQQMDPATNRPVVTQKTLPAGPRTGK